MEVWKRNPYAVGYTRTIAMMGDVYSTYDQAGQETQTERNEGAEFCA